MKVIKKETVQGEWAKANQDIMNGDTITILNSGQEIQGTFGKQLTFNVQTRNGEKILGFNQTTVNNLIDALGDETESWVNKQVQAMVVKQMISGQLKDVIYLNVETHQPAPQEDLPTINVDESMQPPPF